MHPPATRRVFRPCFADSLPQHRAVFAACRGDSVAPLPLAVATIGAIPATVAGAPTGDSIRVRVTEVGGGARSGISVSFAVTAGGGSVSPAIATTDADGRAAAKFTTGTTLGVNTVTATVAGVAPATSP